jgi:hypothetical protein
MLTVIKDFPPNYELLKQVFKLSDNILFCYGHKLYNPSNCYIDPIVLEHESIHEKQQGNDPERWWQRYLIDSAFRFCQELEAYQHQFKEIKKKFKDKNTQARMLNTLASDLSSPNYGSVCSHQEALKSIKENVKFKV